MTMILTLAPLPIEDHASPVYTEMVRRYRLRDGCLLDEGGQCCCYTLDAEIWAGTVAAHDLRVAERLRRHPRAQELIPEFLPRIAQLEAEIRAWLRNR